MVEAKVGETIKTGLVTPAARAGPVGFSRSPYGFRQTLRYWLNGVSGGHFSLKLEGGQPPEDVATQAIAQYGREVVPCQHCTRECSKSAGGASRLVFLGDVMLSKDGHFPKLSPALRDVLAKADVVVANIESPIVDPPPPGQPVPHRGTSLTFRMHSSYLDPLVAAGGAHTKWVFSVANNHAFDGTTEPDDISVLEGTARRLRERFPGCVVVGAEAEGCVPMATVTLAGGCKVGVVAWTDVMNYDSAHWTKPVVRMADIHGGLAKESGARAKHCMLIGFPHGGEEQRRIPVGETQSRWAGLLRDGLLDIIVGHGPHVVQRAESVPTYAGGNGLLFNSIGNFTSPRGPMQTRLGCVLDLALSGAPADGNPGQTECEIRCHLIRNMPGHVSILDEDPPAKDPLRGIVAALRSVWPFDVDND